MDVLRNNRRYMLACAMGFTSMSWASTANGGSHISQLTDGAENNDLGLSPVTGSTFSSDVSPNYRSVGGVSVKQFGAVGDGCTDDTAAIQAAVKHMAINRVALFFPAGTYVTTREVYVDGGYVNMISIDGATLAGNNKTFPAITEKTAPIISYPTRGSAGPLSGCCFYFTSLVYSTMIVGLRIRNYRYGFAFLTSHNSPVFDRITFDSCNAGIICYQGCQNYTLLGCGASGSNCGIIAAATCFPRDTPYAGRDNYYMDGLTIANGTTGYGAFQFSINTFFDEWFRESIFRPDTGSWTIASFGYEYPLSYTDDTCSASGRLVYAPFRNMRDCFYPTFIRVDLRGPNFGGLAILNGQVYGLRIDGLQHEGVWQGYSGRPKSPAWLTLGCVVPKAGGVVENVSTEQQGGVDAGHLFYRVSKVGKFASGTEQILHQNCDIIL